ncbi:MAG: aldo/keto reductase [Candidatus Latescibacteria bacterium]|nr:aldo/keto reductase [Candidatus Latescibacterota bacterium]
MRYRTIGSTGVELSEVGFGSWAVGGPSTLGSIVTGWGKTDDDESIAAMESAFDGGVTFFDTADVYGMGHSEELIGRLFAGRRAEIVIASKGGNRVSEGDWRKDYSFDYIRRAVDASLGRLGTDYLDIYFLHTPRNSEQFDECLRTLESLESLRGDGTIRCTGISVADPSQGVAMIGSGLGQVIQVVHNILNTEPERELFPLAVERGVGVVARVPLASGFLTGKFTRETRFAEDDHRSWAYPPEKIAETAGTVERLGFLVNENRSLAQASLQYILSREAVTSVIPGAKNVRQAVENAAASDLGPMSESELRRIGAAVVG